MKQEKHLVLSDLHIPDHNLKALELALKAIALFKPDVIHLMGDVVNFTDVGSYDKDPYYEIRLADEVEVCKKILKRITDIAHKADPKVEVSWYEGNHEERLQRYLRRNASEIASLEILEEKILSIPHIFELKDFGISWIPYQRFISHKDVVFNHGTISRIKGGYSAHAFMDKSGMNSIQGHTHRLAMVSRTQLGKTIWGIENGCLCNIPPRPNYAPNPDWQQGFTTIIFEGTKSYPTLHPIVGGSLRLGDRLLRL